MRGGADTVVRTPRLAAENGALRAQNAALRTQNDELQERLARIPAAQRHRARAARAPDGIEATVIGYDPEATTHVVTIDRGAKDGVHRDDGVVTGEGVVGADRRGRPAQLESLARHRRHLEAARRRAARPLVGDRGRHARRA